MGDAQFRAFLTDAFTAANSVMRDGAAFYIWHADSEGFNFRGACREAGWQIRQCLIWNKNSLVLGRQDYQWKHEPCLYGWKDGAAHYFVNDRTQTTVLDEVPIELEKLKKDELLKLIRKIIADYTQTTVLDENKPNASRLHPTMKPIALLAKLILNSSKPGQIILDNFGGSGSTLIACEQLDRVCRTVELDPHYCRVIVDRWEKLTGKEAVKING